MIEYKILKEIEKNPFQTQRNLAGKLGVSLGKINYVLSGLVEKGIIKAKKIKSEPDKIRWQYILTPSGLREKLSITRKYLNTRIKEFDTARQEIAMLRDELKNAETE
jgi:EPS-associated MarR family transcriptional regulator